MFENAPLMGNFSVGYGLRARAGEELEKEENKSAGAAVRRPPRATSARGMTPLGMYSSMKSFLWSS